MKEGVFYTQAMERENAFLRQEIERVKYSKDKDSYSRFISGLMKNKGLPAPIGKQVSFTESEE